jgi:hypothetical protein
MADPLTQPGDIIHIDDGRAVQVIDAQLDDWPRIGEDGGTVRCVVVRTRPVKLPDLPADDPRRGIMERIRTALGGSQTAQDRAERGR